MDSRVPRKIFVPKSGKVTEELIKQHNEKLYELYFSPYINPVTK